LIATVSARALNVDGSSFMGFFDHHGTRPQRIGASSTLPSRMATMSTVSVGAMLWCACRFTAGCVSR